MGLNMGRWTSLLFALLSISACMTVSNSDDSSIEKAAPTIITQPKPPLLDDAFSNENTIHNVISIKEVFTLTEEQETHFLNKYSSNEYATLTPNNRIAEYLENHLDNFNFHSDTLIATDSLAKDLGNCLSLAILTKSLTNLTNVDISYQLVETPPVYQKENGLLLSSQHVRTVLYSPTDTPTDGFGHYFRSKTYIDYFPSAGTRFLRKVEENEFYSMFYRNKAVEAMIVDKLNLAFVYLKKSLLLKQDDVQAINIMAVLHEKINRYDYAEKLYIYGLKYGNEKFELLNNYHSLLEKLDRHDEANVIASRLKRYDDPNPFKWVALADQAYHAKNYYAAISYYKKAAKLADYLHQPYAGIAKSYYQVGNIQMAQKAIVKALENSHKEQTSSIYQKKYKLFSKQLSEK